jgi:hypothetical protein
MFAVGTGPSTPAEYSAPANIDPVVIDDIVRFVAPETPNAPLGKRLFSSIRGRRS